MSLRLNLQAINDRFGKVVLEPKQLFFNGPPLPGTIMVRARFLQESSVDKRRGMRQECDSIIVNNDKPLRPHGLADLFQKVDTVRWFVSNLKKQRVMLVYL